MTKTRNTKHALITTAHGMFAERGYDGVSIADIAGSLGITKQALLHHFGTKEKLYGVVLEQVSGKFETILTDHMDGDAGPKERFLKVLRKLHEHMVQNKDDARLIIRELLENRERIAGKRKWYLRPFLEHLSHLLKMSARDGMLSDEEAFTRVYQMLGAMNYFAVSDPTLNEMLGKERFVTLERMFLEQLETVFSPG